MRILGACIFLSLLAGKFIPRSTKVIWGFEGQVKSIKCKTNAKQVFTLEMSLIAIFLVERSIKKENGFLVSKETVVLRRRGRSQQKFGFIKRVDKCWITNVKDVESWRFER